MPSGLAYALRPSTASKPPATFRRAIRSAEEASAAWLLGGGPFGKASSGRTAAQKAGLRYERGVKGRLELLFDNFHSGPWYAYRLRNEVRYCQPDGLVFLPDLTIIFEIKHSFVPEALDQLQRLYAPVIRLAHCVDRLALVTICRNFDPQRADGERQCLVRDIEIDTLRKLSAVGVYLWRF